MYRRLERSMEELTIALVKRTAELGPLLLGSGPNRGHCAVEQRREIIPY